MAVAHSVNLRLLSQSAKISRSDFFYNLPDSHLKRINSSMLHENG